MPTEPLYAAYLDHTSVDHPGPDEILASQPRDWRTVDAALTGPVPGGRPIWYQKHMTHHVHEGMGPDWLEALANCFLLRDSRELLASYPRIRADVTLADTDCPSRPRSSTACGAQRLIPTTRPGY